MKKSGCKKCSLVLAVGLCLSILGCAPGREVSNMSAEETLEEQKGVGEITAQQEQEVEKMLPLFCAIADSTWAFDEPITYSHEDADWYWSLMAECLENIAFAEKSGRAEVEALEPERIEQLSRVLFPRLSKLPKIAGTDDGVHPMWYEEATQTYYHNVLHDELPEVYVNDIKEIRSLDEEGRRLAVLVEVHTNRPVAEEVQEEEQGQLEEEGITFAGSLGDVLNAQAEAAEAETSRDKMSRGVVGEYLFILDQIQPEEGEELPFTYNIRQVVQDSFADPLMLRNTEDLGAFIEGWNEIYYYHLTGCADMPYLVQDVVDTIADFALYPMPVTYAGETVAVDYREHLKGSWTEKVFTPQLCAALEEAWLDYEYREEKEELVLEEGETYRFGNDEAYMTLVQELGGIRILEINAGDGNVTWQDDMSQLERKSVRQLHEDKNSQLREGEDGLSDQDEPAEAQEEPQGQGIMLIEEDEIELID